MLRTTIKTATLLALVCVVGCSWSAPSHESVVIDGHPSGGEAPSFAGVPCGPFFQSPSILDPFVHWSHDGAWLVIAKDDIIGAVATDGSGYREIVDVNTGRYQYLPNLVHGLYADASPTDARIVFTSCERIPSDPNAAKRDNDDDGYEPRPANRLGYELVTKNAAPGAVDWNRLTENRGLEHFPVWSPDGAKIAYLQNPAEYLKYGPGALVLYVMNADGSERRSIPRPGGDRVALFPPVWSPDGQRLAFITPGDGSSKGMGTVVTAHIDSQSRERGVIGHSTALPTWSRDSTEVVFATYDGAVAEILIARYDGTGQRSVWRSPEGTVSFPVTTLERSPVGNELMFVTDAVFAIDLDDGEARLLVHPGFSKGLAASWSPDGAQIAVYQPCWAEDQLRAFVREAPGNVCYKKQYILMVSADGGQVRGLPILERRPPEIPESRQPVDLSVCSAGIVVPDPEANPGLVQDCETLLTLRDTLAGDGHLAWDGSTPIDQWQGIGLEHHHRAAVLGYADPTAMPRVRRLELFGRELTGRLSPEISRLTELESIEIGSTSIGGIIPPEWGRLTKLLALSLAGNGLEGPIPPELGDMERLLTLNLGYNSLSGTVPPELAKATEVWQLSLRDNLLVGSIPVEYDVFTKIALPSLSGNLWGGCIPWGLRNVWMEATGLPKCP